MFWNRLCQIDTIILLDIITHSGDGEGVTDDFQPNPSCSELIQVGCNSTLGSMLNLDTCLNQTPIPEWHVIRCSSKTHTKKDMHLKEIGMCSQNISQNMLTILGSIVNIIGGLE